MGAFLDKPKTTKTSEEGEGNGVRFGVACMQGWRIDMEDSHRIVFPLPGKLANWSFYSVFDGHAGAKVAENAAKGLIHKILEQDQFIRLSQDSSLHNDQELIKQGIIQGFLQFDDKLLADNKDEKSGSTAIVAFVTPTMIIVGNCGDSRGMIVSDGRVVFESMDHKPADPLETERIQNAGGSVLLQRINGALAVSRSLGDFDYKKNSSVSNVQQLVIAEPVVTFYQRNPAKDQMLFLACDGIWDVFNSTNLTSYLLHRLECEESFATISEQLLDLCLYMGSRDNMSALIVGLDACPKVNSETKKRDEEMNKTIVDLADKFCRQNPDLSTSNSIFESIESELDTKTIPNGLMTKRYLVEEVFRRYNKSEEDDPPSPNVRRQCPTYGLDDVMDFSKPVPKEQETV